MDRSEICNKFASSLYRKIKYIPNIFMYAESGKVYGFDSSDLGEHFLKGYNPHTQNPVPQSELVRAREFLAEHPFKLVLGAEEIEEYIDHIARNCYKFKLEEKLVNSEGLIYLADNLHRLEHITRLIIDLKCPSISQSPFATGILSETSKHYFLERLSCLTNLKYLELRDSDLNDCCVCSIGSLVNLKSLYVSHNNLTDISIEHILNNLRSFPNLKYIYTYRNQFEVYKGEAKSNRNFKQIITKRRHTTVGQLTKPARK